MLRKQQALAVLVAVLVAAVLLTGGRAQTSTAAPGGLLPEQIPQFVVFTHDDLLNGKSYDIMRSITDGRQTADGCAVPATMFVSTKQTDCERAKELHRLGYELASHTIIHKRLLGEPRSFVESEVLGPRQALAACGIPEADVAGFRAPFLDVDQQLRQVLLENGFLYDSSIVAESAEGFGSRLWPFDMGAGISINCTNYEGSYGTHRQTCDTQERWPGLWQVPVWRLTELDGPYQMDPGFSYAGMYQASSHSASDILKANFDASYAGNRAPMPLYVHSFFLRTGDNVAEVQRFIDYALSKPNTYFVTMRQLLAWMKNPVPADQLTPEALGCGNPGGAGPPEPQQQEQEQQPEPQPEPQLELSEDRNLQQAAPAPAPATAADALAPGPAALPADAPGPSADSDLAAPPPTQPSAPVPLATSAAGRLTCCISLAALLVCAMAACIAALS